MDLGVSILKWSGLVCTLILFRLRIIRNFPERLGTRNTGERHSPGWSMVLSTTPLNIVRLLPLLCPVSCGVTCGGGGGANRMAPPGRGSASSMLKPPLIPENTKATSVMAAQAGRKACKRPPTRMSGGPSARGEESKTTTALGRLAMTALTPLSAVSPSIGPPAAAPCAPVGRRGR